MQLGIHGGLTKTFKGVYANRGLRGFYAGYGSLLLREIPYSCIQMPIYEAMKRMTRNKKGLGPKENDFTPFENARHAMVAGGTGKLLELQSVLPDNSDRCDQDEPDDQQI